MNYSSNKNQQAHGASYTASPLQGRCRVRLWRRFDERSQQTLLVPPQSLGGGEFNPR